MCNDLWFARTHTLSVEDSGTFSSGTMCDTLVLNSAAAVVARSSYTRTLFNSLNMMMGVMVLSFPYALKVRLLLGEGEEAAYTLSPMCAGDLAAMLCLCCGCDCGCCCDCGCGFSPSSYVLRAMCCMLR
jgi:hypothetical protein